MNHEHERLTPEEQEFVANLRRTPAVTPPATIRERIVAETGAARVAAAGRRWPGRLAAAAIVAAVGITILFPPARSSAPARLAIDGAVLDAGSRSSGLTRHLRELETMEREIR